MGALRYCSAAVPACCHVLHHDGHETRSPKFNVFFLKVALIVVFVTEIQKWLRQVMLPLEDLG